MIPPKRVFFPSSWLPFLTHVPFEVGSDLAYLGTLYLQERGGKYEVQREKKGTLGPTDEEWGGFYSVGFLVIKTYSYSLDS